MEEDPPKGGTFKIAPLDDDYRTWAFYCKAHLMSRGIWHTVVEPCPVVPPPLPEGDAHATAAYATARAEAIKSRKTWIKHNEFALADIQLTIKPHLVQEVCACTTAAEAWEALKGLFEQDTTSRRAGLEQDLASLQMHAGESLIKYVGRAKDLRAALAMSGLIVEEHSMVIKVLRGLPEGYAMIRTVLENYPSTLRLSDVTSKLMPVEKLLNENGSKGSSSGSAYSGTGKANTPIPKKEGKKKVKCNYCKKMGHPTRECRFRKANESKGESKGGAASAEAMGFSARAGGHKSRKRRPSKWMVDSGATHHMTNGKNVADSYKVTEEAMVERITMASGTTAAVVGQGWATLEANGKAGSRPIHLDGTLCVPELQENLLSVGTVDKKGGAVIFADGKVHLFQRAEVVIKSGVLDHAGATGFMDHRGQYVIGQSGVPAMARVAAGTVKGAPALWHRRTFHRALSTLGQAAKMVDGLPAAEVKADREAGAICTPCAKAKLVKAPYHDSTSETDVLDLLHTDICGPFEPSLGGTRYFITIIDDNTGLMMAVPIKSKSQAGDILRDRIPMLEQLAGRKAKRLRSDGALEYATKDLKEWYASKGIIHETTLPYSHQSNGRAERANRTLKEMVRAALADADAGQYLWAEALVAAVYVANRMPHADKDVTPWEAVTGKRPNVSGFRVWGSKAYALLPPEQQKGMYPKTTSGFMVGYAADGRGYRVFDPKAKRVVARRDVTVDEAGDQEPKEDRHVHWGGTPGSGDLRDEAPEAGAPIPVATPRAVPQLTPSSSGGSRAPGPVRSSVEEAVAAAQQLAAMVPLPDDDDSEEEAEDEVRRYPVRTRSAPEAYGRTATGDDVKPAESGKRTTAADLPPPPKDVEEAKTRADWPLWKEALRVEEESMDRKRVWRRKKLPRGGKALKTRVIFEYKFKASGELDRYKARIVGCGCRQRPGRDYRETWSPVPAAPTTRAVLASAAARKWHVHHVDIRTAYLNAPMDMDVYIIIPDGFKDAGEVGLLLKAMYGVKQAGRLWGLFLRDTIMKAGGKPSEADACLYTFGEGEQHVVVETHVDDILLAGAQLRAVLDIKAEIAKHFEVRDLGVVSDFLGMEVRWTKGGVTLANPRHTTGVLTDYGMLDCKPKVTPMAPGTVLGGGEPLPEGNQYAELIGSLLFLANQTRPDISFAVGKLARRVATPTDGDMVAAKAVVRYLKGTRGMGLVYGQPAKLAGWVDADFAGDTESRKSTTGFLFTLHGGTISWRSRLQSIVTTSTAEAEYVAASDAVKESQWLRKVVSTLKEDSSPVRLGEDNQACLAIAGNTTSSPNTKHVDVRLHHVKDAVAKGEVILEYVPTGEMPADGFTKALARPAFKAFRLALGVRDVNG